MRYLDTSPAVEKGRWAVVDDLDVLGWTTRRFASARGPLRPDAVESGLARTRATLCALLKPLPPPPPTERRRRRRRAADRRRVTFNMKLLATTGTIANLHL